MVNNMPCVPAWHSDVESNFLNGKKIPNIRIGNSSKRQ
jgi:hypothetical protein